MRRQFIRMLGLLAAPAALLFLTGCDAANIVFASLDLASAIVGAAT